MSLFYFAKNIIPYRLPAATPRPGPENHSGSRDHGGCLRNPADPGKHLPVKRIRKTVQVRGHEDGHGPF